MNKEIIIIIIIIINKIAIKHIVQILSGNVAAKCQDDMIDSLMEILLDTYVLY